MIIAVTITLLAGFFVLSGIFWVIERFWPAVPGQPHWRRDSKTDLAYWFMVGSVGQWFVRFVVIVAAVIVGIAATRTLEGEVVRDWLTRDTALSSQPALLQAIEILFLVDFIGYWSHRVFHRWGPAWRFHAVHHSSRQVDWLSSVRLHPINDAATSVCAAIALVGIGFDARTLSWAIPFFTFYAIMVHANVSWTFGPLRYVVISPVFHRWHHTTEKEGLDKNFAGLFPFWDLLFGTFYLPRDRQPMEFGVLRESVPESFWRQLVYPFYPGIAATK